MQPLVDLKLVDPLPHRKVVAFVNNFIINSTQFLNRFSNLCEEKLEHVSRNLQRLEITLSILELKLASIPELQGVTSGTPAPTAESSVPVAAPTTAPAPPGPEDAVQSSSDEPEASSVSGAMTWREDPRYASFFRLLKVGVPLGQVQQKCQVSGLDPDVLANPDGLSDYAESAAFGAASSTSSEESDEDQ